MVVIDTAYSGTYKEVIKGRMTNHVQKIATWRSDKGTCSYTDKSHLSRQGVTNGATNALQEEQTEMEVYKISSKPT